MQPPMASKKLAAEPNGNFLHSTYASRPHSSSAMRLWAHGQIAWTRDMFILNRWFRCTLPYSITYLVYALQTAIPAFSFLGVPESIPTACIGIDTVLSLTLYHTGIQIVV